MSVNVCTFEYRHECVCESGYLGDRLCKCGVYKRNHEITA